MALTFDEAREHAARIIKSQEVEFSDVYEDEELEGLGEEDWRLVHQYVRSAKVEVTF